MASINIQTIETPMGNSLSSEYLLSDDQAEQIQGGLLQVTGCFEAFRRCDPPRFPLPGPIGGPIGPRPDPVPVILLA